MENVYHAVRKFDCDDVNNPYVFRHSTIKEKNVKASGSSKNARDSRYTNNTLATAIPIHI